MTAAIVQPASEALTQRAYLALQWSLSYPGRAHQLPVAYDGAHDFVVIARTLLDLETSYFTNDDALARQLAHTGAKSRGVASAAYVFLPVLDDGSLELVEQVSVGSYAYPDESATLICGCVLDAPDGDALTFSGPGVDGSQAVCIGGVPHAFWEVRRRLIRYPLGFDVFFVDGGHVVGVPRTAEVIGNW
jgi:alpha-D-ribose 1-methylphosphonate 5-triphosphate synthase subunit PhnH